MGYDPSSQFGYLAVALIVTVYVVALVGSAAGIYLIFVARGDDQKDESRKKPEPAVPHWHIGEQDGNVFMEIELNEIFLYQPDSPLPKLSLEQKQKLIRTAQS